VRRTLLLLTLLACGGALAADGMPLFDFAQQLPFEPMTNDQQLRRRLARAEHDLKQNPPPEADCARTLGANRFADLYDGLGATHFAMGEMTPAIDAFRKSIACNPRNANVHASLAAALVHAAQPAQARAEAERGRAIDPENLEPVAILMQLDFVEERWPEAIASLRRLIADTPDTERATYWQCFLWLAQLRSGLGTPGIVAAELTDDWPRPLIDWLEGNLTEEQVLERVKDVDNDKRLREMLAEALYYTGQARLARRENETARLYFTATVNLKVTYFIEHRMALAELAKIRASSGRSP
jgi:tetratricopeptide (TPR) repeat protein